MDKTGAELIAAERTRQIEEEGFTPEHDAVYGDNELASAAYCYLTCMWEGSDEVPAEWPWHPNWWKPSDSRPIRNLVKAGALIAAEIDRRQRLGLT